MINNKNMAGGRCAFGCPLKDEDIAYLAFIDGMAEQTICAICANDIREMPLGMTFVIGEIGGEAEREYMKELD